ncbi:MAG: cyclic nucleotide-binding domain-containing protein [Candidatus Dormibacteraeota bacterium]|nr:cyclic nucleotide-binding domain-containing protein [Candidatus Dormibacteraeota bacterium]
MRIESSVTSISWIPSEAIAGVTKLPFQMGVAHYDDAPPDHVDDLVALRDADRFRFANELRAWIEVSDEGRVVDHGYEGSGLIGSTTMRLGGRVATFAAVAFPDLRRPAEVGDGWVRFAQTCGGRTGVPAPRRVSHPPFIQVAAPLAWTTLSLTLFSDGRSSHELAGASPFPRHWIYDGHGDLALKSGLVDFKAWYQRAFGQHTPWGDEESPALVSEVETALERELSRWIMRGAAPPVIGDVRSGGTLLEEGDVGNDILLVLDGVVTVEVGGVELGQLGPGAVVGERALLEGGRRTATVRAVTNCRVASVAGDSIDPRMLSELAATHRREESAESRSAS